MENGGPDQRDLPDKGKEMTKGTEIEKADTVNGAVFGYADSAEYQWTTVHTEAADQIQFEEDGDTYIGIYAGHEIIYPEPQKEPLNYFVQLRWTDPVSAKFANAGYELEKAYVDIVFAPDGTIASHTDKVPLGSMTRNQQVKRVPTGKKDPMRSFRVDIGTLVNADHSA